MDLSKLGINVAPFKFMEGVGGKTQYLELANSKTLRVGMRPIIGSGNFEDSPYIFLIAKLRVEGTDTLPNIPVYVGDGGKHSSAVVGVPMAKAPCSPVGAALMWEVYYKHLVDEVFTALEAGGVKLTTTKEVAYEYVESVYSEALPNDAPTPAPLDAKLQFLYSGS